MNALYVECHICGAKPGALCKQDGRARLTVHPARVSWAAIKEDEAATESEARGVAARAYEFPAPRDPQTYTARINGHEVLVTIWPAGLAQVAERADSGESWSAPETLSPLPQGVE